MWKWNNRQIILFQVEKFHPIDIQPADISFEWALPGNEQNGIIRKFTVTYGLEVSEWIVLKCISFWVLHVLLYKNYISVWDLQVSKIIFMDEDE